MIVDRTTHADVSHLSHRLHSGKEREMEQPQIIEEALDELYKLLESYAPVWYTKEHHDKALSALRLLRS